MPLLIAIGVVVGIFLGSFFTSLYSGRSISIRSSGNKVNDLFHLISDEYVDTVNVPDLVEKSIPQILKQLDPHSVYISAAEVDASMQDLRGGFSGIGVQFTILSDTVRVVRVIKGGPSERAGLHAGDRIVAIDDADYVGPVVTNDETMKRLKGPEGSKVKLRILRDGAARPLTFTITRGNVPVRSITAAYMLNDSIGYIKIHSFGETTYAEFLAAMAALSRYEMSGLMLDLRGNLGGYMEPAVQIANEFLSKNSLIVYTMGRRSPRQEYCSDGRGAYQTVPLVLLIDETTASASEILAGAIQDNDRGTIVGRRSFGKGLVQVPIEFSDGSMLRLTTARYYTPSGRCVQKPYVPGDDEEYESDLLLRAAHGEYDTADSIKTSGDAYTTTLGRTVYGGGGIIPDIFVAQDTTGYTSYFKEAYIKGLIFQFAYILCDNHRAQLERLADDPQRVAAYLDRIGMLQQFQTYAQQNGLKPRPLLLQRSSKLFKDIIVSNVLNDLVGDEASVEYVNRSDATVKAGLEVFATGSAFPQRPADTAAPQVAAAFFNRSLVTGHRPQLGFAWRGRK